MAKKLDKKIEIGGTVYDMVDGSAVIDGALISPQAVANLIKTGTAKIIG